MRWHPKARVSLLISVVFFGENLTPQQRELAFQMVDECTGMVVIGSSLQVYSAYRLARRIKDQGKPLTIINLGETRADTLADTKIDDECTRVLRDWNLKLSK
jgi:NAD-dependent deacetylase sirtuin 4